MTLEQLQKLADAYATRTGAKAPQVMELSQLVQSFLLRHPECVGAVCKMPYRSIYSKRDLQ